MAYRPKKRSLDKTETAKSESTGANARRELRPRSTTRIMLKGRLDPSVVSPTNGAKLTRFLVCAQQTDRRSPEKTLPRVAHISHPLGYVGSSFQMRPMRHAFALMSEEVNMTEVSVELVKDQLRTIECWAAFWSAHDMERLLPLFTERVLYE
jgi:hypothetical protein